MSTFKNPQLKEELKMIRDFASLDEQCLLSFVLSESHFKKLSYNFFFEFGLTDVQFNILHLLSDHETGLKQYELADRLLVNRASLGGVVDRMIKNNFVVRQQDATDRRANIIKLTSEGDKLFHKVKEPYDQQVDNLFSNFNKEEKKDFVTLLQKFRSQINHTTDEEE
jgi:DNA-binding MarR family transcriptional regulator